MMVGTESERKENSSFVPVPKTGTIVHGTEDVFPHGVVPTHLDEFSVEVAIAAKRLSDAMFDCKSDTEAEFVAARALTAASGTKVLDEVLAILDETLGFASLSHGARNNLEEAAGILDDMRSSLETGGRVE